MKLNRAEKNLLKRLKKYQDSKGHGWFEYDIVAKDKQMIPLFKRLIELGYIRYIDKTGGYTIVFDEEKQVEEAQ